ncbi:MAG TPA: hypothetical protein VHC22_23465 [Pirellulales bacterium]|nr:hypothetical protein [Pirellulales bacterium]
MSRIARMSVLLLVLVCGCGGSPSKVAVFVKAQQNAVTPHGKIDLNSVREAPDGDIMYRTTDGSCWKVSMEIAADGQPRFGEPAEENN